MGRAGLSLSSLRSMLGALIYLVYVAYVVAETSHGRASRLEFLSCPAEAPGCKLKELPQLHAFLKDIEQGGYPGVTVKYTPDEKHYKVAMIAKGDVVLGFQIIDQFTVEELKSFIAAKGFKHRGEALADPNLISFIALTTSLGVIRVQLRPDWSEGSVEYVRKLARNPELCTHECQFYRAEKGGVLQGALKATIPCNNVTTPGPKFMEKGDIGWAGGEPGPHFFIYLGNSPAKGWGFDHTVWGVVADAQSMAVAEAINDLPSVASDPRGWPKMLVKREALKISVSS